MDGTVSGTTICPLDLDTDIFLIKKEFLEN